MIRTAYNNRFRDHKAGQARASRPARRDAAPRRESRRENATVVHPWMSLPDRLAAAQAAMRELAGHGAFNCPLDESLKSPGAATSQHAEAKPRPAGVNVIIRKRRLPASEIHSLSSAG